MTDRPMDGTADPGGHPDEGLIHAWLDEALDAAESERLAAHVRDCPTCQARVAEARGLIAGASRIVAALDDVPVGTRPGWAQSAVASGESAGVGPGDVVADRPPQGSLWRWLRVTPGRAALAATILVALGITLTHERLADDSARSVTAVLNPQRADAPALDSAGGPGAGYAVAEKAPARDELLDSAVARNLMQSQGKRTVGAAPGQPLPQAPPAPSSAAPPALGSERVAEGRAAAQTRRDITGAVASDRARVGAAVGASEADLGAMSGIASAAVQNPVAPQGANGAMMAREMSDAAARSCLRLESSESGATWGDQPFPLVIALEPGPASESRSASVLTTSGAPTSARATWSARDGDSVSIALRRIGYSGTIVLGPGGGARSGVAVSGPAGAQLEQVVTADAPQSQARARATGERAEARKAAAPTASAAPQPTGAPRTGEEAGPPVRQLRVTARPIACPAR